MSSLCVEQQLGQWAALAMPGRDPSALAMARSSFMDLTACLLAGSRDPGVRLLIQAVGHWDAEGENLAVGTSRRHHPPWAALINATAAHALDFDDNFLPAFTHATAVIGPALLAIAEPDHLGGDALLNAYLVGLELHARIGTLVNPIHFQRGWHPTATIGAIGTAGACARLLGLDAQGIRTAMGIAFSMAAGSKAQFGSMMKPTQAGLAAQHAVMAAQMAATGITATPDFLFGPFGFQALYGSEDDSKGPDAVVGLGQKLMLREYGLLVKRFPCCASAHKTLDGLLHMRQTHHIQPGEIQRITARIPRTLSQNLPFKRPRNEIEARFSLPYCAARVLKEGSLSLSHFAPGAVNDPEVIRLADRVFIETTPDPEVLQVDMPIYSAIEMQDGKRYEIETIHLKGSPADPLTDDELGGKLLGCCRFAGIDIDAGDNLVSILSRIDTCVDIAVLMDALRDLFTEDVPSMQNGRR